MRLTPRAFHKELAAQERVRRVVLLVALEARIGEVLATSEAVRTARAPTIVRADRMVLLHDRKRLADGALFDYIFDNISFYFTFKDNHFSYVCRCVTNHLEGTTVHVHTAKARRVQTKK